METQNCKNFRL